MCKAIEEMIEDGFKKGESEGFKKGRDSILKALQAGGYSANELNQMMSIVAQTV